MSSTRKPHNEDAGYICELRNRITGNGHVVIYIAEKQGLDVGAKYAVVCTQHHTILGVSSLPKARPSMKWPDFCEECMKIAALDAQTVHVDPADIPERFGGKGE